MIILFNHTLLTHLDISNRSEGQGFGGGGGGGGLCMPEVTLDFAETFVTLNSKTTVTSNPMTQAICPAGLSLGGLLPFFCNLLPSISFCWPNSWKDSGLHQLVKGYAFWRNESSCAKSFAIVWSPGARFRLKPAKECWFSWLKFQRERIELVLLVCTCHFYQSCL